MEETSLDNQMNEQISISGLYENWFLEYASYVILDRAVPALEDGLKPVQRRILHAMYEINDDRFHKVANIIGQTMAYHPHGDASIGEAIVNLGQKDLLIDTQGNWGDIRTGDTAAAPRYIEAKLSKFALEVLFNPQTTDWTVSYDGRKREPITLPAKFPILLAQGVEGIAVGLSTKILPHNFCELILASIAFLKNEEFELIPDFPTGGMIDPEQYKDGLRGGRVKIRAKVEELDKKTLIIKDLPFGVTSVTLIDSIVKANDSGKIKIKKVIDNTAKDVEILIQLLPGISTDITIDALYAFTDCAVSVSPNACIIIEQKPHFVTVSDILKLTVTQTKALLGRELEILIHELKEKIFFSSLLKIFIAEGMYKNQLYESAESNEKSFEVLNVLFEPHFPIFFRAITNDDYLKLMAKPLSSIRRFDFKEADLKLKELEADIKKSESELNHLTDYTIKYYQNLLNKYGKGRERKTEIRQFDSINASVVAANNQKLYVNRKEGFIGFGIKKDEFVCECSDLDDIIVFRKDGNCQISRISEKVFVGKDIEYVNIFKKNDERTVYHLIYFDGKSGNTYVKRFQVSGITRDKEYDLTQGNKGTKLLYFSVQPNGEAEKVSIFLSQACSAKIKVFDFDFAELAIKGRSSQGNILTKYPIKKIQFKSSGGSTLGGVKIWYNPQIGKLNSEGYGEYLGVFDGEDKLVNFSHNGNYEITDFQLTNRFEPSELLAIYKFDANQVHNLIYKDGITQTHYLKRFKIETTSLGKKFNLITEHKDSKIKFINHGITYAVDVEIKRNNKNEILKLSLHDMIDVKGWKAQGVKLPFDQIINISDHKEKITLPSEKFEAGDTIEIDLKKRDNTSEQLGLF